MEDLLAAAGMPRATFFYDQKRLEKPDKHAAVKQTILGSIGRNKHRYGHRQVLPDLRNKGWLVNHKLVYKLIRQMGLRTKIRQRKPFTSYAGTIRRIAGKKFDCKFTPDKPYTIFVSDVTEFRTAGRKVYLSPVMDLIDRPIVPHTVSKSLSIAFIVKIIDKSDCGLCAEGWVDDAHLPRLPIPAVDLAYFDSRQRRCSVSVA
ncbi:IS3 family transposase [Corynebacterium kefirresidentii]|uniref:IS3 family transposase n=1 Tax=Corynebacterium sp. CTNIH14 TaxID=3230065 RepID=UPI002934EC88|nr:IS3 family transposase [Corynebacterium kefirresidentii]MDV2415403.1 IS3 family transposase [Corynebacterium kefirresidentii]